jgi:hypothetical protein
LAGYFPAADKFKKLIDQDQRSEEEHHEAIVWLAECHGNQQAAGKQNTVSGCEVGEEFHGSHTGILNPYSRRKRHDKSGNYPCFAYLDLGFFYF